MGKWCGLGQPPTRRKLHRLRAERQREQRAAARLVSREERERVRSARMFDRAMKGCKDR